MYSYTNKTTLYASFSCFSDTLRPNLMLPINRTLGFSAVFVNVLITFFTSGWSGATPNLSSKKDIWVRMIIIIYLSLYLTKPNGTGSCS